MLRLTDNVYRQGVNAVFANGGVSYWFNISENTTIPLSEEFVKQAIEEKFVGIMVTAKEAMNEQR